MMNRSRLWLVLLFVPMAPLLGGQSQAPPIITDQAIRAVAAAVIADQTAATAAQAPSSPESPPSLVPQTGSRQQYWKTYAWLTASTIYDVESTFYLQRRCEECRETNPIVRPFVTRGRGATYAYSAAINALAMYAARRMQKNGDLHWRLLPRALSIVHGVAGSWNAYNASRPPD